jgi:hypothetical protein
MMDFLSNRVRIKIFSIVNFVSLNHCCFINWLDNITLYCKIQLLSKVKAKSL